MKRKKFMQQMGLGGVVALLGGVTHSKAASETSTYKPKTNTNIKQVGFNHINTMETKTKTSVLHKSNTRGDANHGWLKSKHSFSFANYYNPERMNFGVLRVLNDDDVAAGRGFGKHPHANMEIISIPLEGDLKHMDSTGRSEIIKQGDVQVMSAGSGLEHSEMNANADKGVKFLQIWVVPNKENVTPRYQQITLKEGTRDNRLEQILSPSADDAGVWIHQDAWFYLGKLDKGTTIDHAIHKKGNGVYAFVLEGDVVLNGQALNRRDGYGVWDVDTVSLTASEHAEVLLMEVPMGL